MSTATIEITDRGDSNSMTVTYAGGYDLASPSHAAIRRVVAYIDSLGIEIKEPDSNTSAEAQGASVIQLLP